MFELVQSGVERSIAYLQYVAGNLLQSLADGPAVKRLKGKNLKDQQIKGALNEIRRLTQTLTSRLPRDHSASSLGKQGE